MRALLSGVIPLLAATLLLSAGLLFSVWLTYLELFVIHAICQWCVISAILATILFILSWLDFRDVSALQDERASEVAESLREGSFGAGIRNTGEVAMRAIGREEP